MTTKLLSFTLLALACLAPGARAGQAPAGAEAVAALQREVRELKAMVAGSVEAQARRQRELELQAEKRAADLKRVEEIVNRLRPAGEKAEGSKEMAELRELAASPEQQVRRYLAASVDRLPKELVGKLLVSMLADESTLVVCEVLCSLRVLGEDGGREAVAARLAAMTLTEGLATRTADLMAEQTQRVIFLRLAGEYLTRLDDTRGVAICMQHLARSLARYECWPRDPRYRGYYMGGVGYQICANSMFLESVNDWVGKPVTFPKPDRGGYATPEQAAANCRKLLDWWEANREAFKLPVPAAAAAAVRGPNVPERF